MSGGITRPGVISSGDVIADFFSVYHHEVIRDGGLCAFEPGKQQHAAFGRIFNELLEEGQDIRLVEHAFQIMFPAPCGLLFHHAFYHTFRQGKFAVDLVRYFALLLQPAQFALECAALQALFLGGGFQPLIWCCPLNFEIRRTVFFMQVGKRRQGNFVNGSGAHVP